LEGSKSMGSGCRTQLQLIGFTDDGKVKHGGYFGKVTKFLDGGWAGNDAVSFSGGVIKKKNMSLVMGEMGNTSFNLKVGTIKITQLNESHTDLEF